MNTIQAFKILNLYPNASKDEVKEAYRLLTKKFHPDVTDWDSTAKFQEINEAYEVAYKHASEKKIMPKPPAKTNAQKTTATATRTSTSVKKSADESSSIGRWLIIGGLALILLILLVPGLQLIVLILLMYGVTRIL